MEELKKLLEEKEEKLHLAATFGNRLLEDNNKLNERLEIRSAEYIRKLEELEQEKYRLKMNLELKLQIENSQVAEIDSLKENLDSLSKTNRNLVEKEKEYQKQISEITKEKNDLEEIHEEVCKNEVKLKERASLLESHLQAAQDQLNQSILNETCSEEIFKLRMELQQLLVEKQTLEQTLSDTICELESCKKQEKKLTESLENNVEMLREKESEVAMYLKAIEEYKEEICELKLEAEMMKMGEHDPNSRGNSLFAEVDDRRRSVEKELISLRIQNEASKEKLSFSVQQINKMRYQMATLLSMATHNSDVAYIQNLEQTLFAAKQEIKELKQQLSELEKLDRHPQQLLVNNMSEDTAHSGYLKAMLEQSRKECKELTKQVQNAMLYKAAETDRAINCQRSLYQTQKKALQLQAEVVRLQTKLDELQKKDDISVPKPIVEKLPLCNKENECKEIPPDCTKRKVIISNEVSVSKADGQIVTEKLKDEHSKMERSCGRRQELPVIASKPIVNDCAQQ